MFGKVCPPVCLHLLKGPCDLLQPYEGILCSPCVFVSNQEMFAFSILQLAVAITVYIHSHKILMTQQGEPCYLSIWSNPCRLHKECQAGRAYYLAKLPELNPVNACRGIPTELTPLGQPCCFVKIL